MSGLAERRDSLSEIHSWLGSLWLIKQTSRQRALSGKGVVLKALMWKAG